MKGYNGSKTPNAIRDSFSTPEYLYWYYNRGFEFVLDVAADAVNHKCEQFYSIEDDALNLPWAKSNWCNPPYSNIQPWVDKAIVEMEQGNTTVMLIPADTSVEWFSTAFNNARTEFITGRISFINASTGKPQSGNNKGSVVFIFEPTPTGSKVNLIRRKDIEDAYKNRAIPSPVIKS